MKGQGEIVVTLFSKRCGTRVTSQDGESLNVCDLAVYERYFEFRVCPHFSRTRADDTDRLSKQRHYLIFSLPRLK